MSLKAKSRVIADAGRNRRTPWRLAVESKTRKGENSAEIVDAHTETWRNYKSVLMDEVPMRQNRRFGIHIEQCVL